MKVEVLYTKENEDGSLDIAFDLDEEAKTYFAKEGLIKLIMEKLTSGKVG